MVFIAIFFRYFGNLSLIELLIEAGANPNSRDANLRIAQELIPNNLTETKKNAIIALLK